MTTQPALPILELIRSAVARGAAQCLDERPYLLLEDLVDAPIEWSLGDQVHAAVGAGDHPFSLH